MPRLRAGLSFCALAAALPAAAQDIQLDPISVEDTAPRGLHGERLAFDTRGVTAIDAPLAETPRAIDIVTAQEIESRGAEDVELVVRHVQRHQFLVLPAQALGREREETSGREAVGMRLGIDADRTIQCNVEGR